MTTWQQDIMQQARQAYGSNPQISLFNDRQSMLGKGLVPIDPNSSTLSGLSPLIGNAVTNSASGTYLDQAALNRTLAGYSAMTPEQVQQFSVLPTFQSLKPAAAFDGRSLYDNSALTQALSNYSLIDPAKLGDDAISKSLQSHLLKLGNASLVDKGTADYYSNLAKTLNGTQIGYYGVSSVADPFKTATYDWKYTGYPAASVTLDGNQGVYIPYEAATRIQNNAATDQLQYYTNILGNEGLYKDGKVVSLPDDVAQSIKSTLGGMGGTTWMMDNPGVGYWLPQDVFDRDVLGSGNFYYGQSKPNSAVNTGRALHDESDLAGAFIRRSADADLAALDSLPSGAGNNPYINELQASKWFAPGNTDQQLFAYQDPNDPNNWKYAAIDQWVEKKKKGGWGGPLGSIATSISDAMKGPAGALVSFAFPTFAAGYYLANGATNAAMGKGNLTSNLLSALGGAMGLSGATSAISNSIGNSLASSGSEFLAQNASKLAPAITNGLMGTAGGLISGQSLGDSLKSGLASGAGSFAGNYVGSNAGLGTIGSSALGGATGSALQALLRGGNVGQSGLYGFLGGLAGGVGREAGLSPAASSGLSKFLTQQLAMQQLRQLAAKRG